MTYSPNAPSAPMTNLGQELGILFAFSAFMVASLVAYWIGWNRYQTRVAKIERERQATLSGTPLYRDATDEKRTVAQRDEPAAGQTKMVEHVG